MSPLAAPSPTPLVYVIEDHDDIAEVVQVNLRRDGYRAEVARDGRQALAMVGRALPDLIVLDLGLPGLDGIALLERLRTAQCWCPVLILSARDADADKLTGFRAGADDYVTKPFRTLELMARVAALLRRSTRPWGPVRGRPAEVIPAAAEPALESAAVVERCGLTLRQAEVALLMAEGLSNPEIAAALDISRFTARNHAEQVLARLRVSARGRVAQALRAACGAPHRAEPPGAAA